MTGQKNPPIDYLSSACLQSLFRVSPSDKIFHSMSFEKLHDFIEKSIDTEFDEEFTQAVIENLKSLNVITVIDDPFADTLITTSDERIADFFNARNDEEDIFHRSWTVGFDWLKTAFQRPAFWASLSSPEEDSENAPKTAPAAEGFVTFDHNQSNSLAVIEAVETAAEIVRSTNAIEETERHWVRGHLDAGLLLLKRGGKILKEAIISTVIRPLQAALKYVVEERAKELIGMAIKFLMSFF